MMEIGWTTKEKGKELIHSCMFIFIEFPKKIKFVLLGLRVQNTPAYGLLVTLKERVNWFTRITDIKEVGHLPPCTVQARVVKISHFLIILYLFFPKNKRKMLLYDPGNGIMRFWQPSFRKIYLWYWLWATWWIRFRCTRAGRGWARRRNQNYNSKMEGKSNYAHYNCSGRIAYTL